MSIIKCTSKTIIDAPARTPDKPRSIRVVKQGASVSTRRDGEDRPVAAKVADVFRESSIESIREKFFGMPVKKWQVQRENRNLNLLGELVK